MRIVLVFNPLSGAGKAASKARYLHSLLVEHSYSPDMVEVGPGARRVSLEESLEGAAAAVVIGGDGTVHHTAIPASRANTPIYGYPMGTENLFAREFGMDRTNDRLLAALAGLRDGHGGAVPAVTYVDAATANGRPFLLMASIGVDANVVHRLSRNRTGAISHMSYAPHIAREIVSPFLRPLTVVADGTMVLDQQYATIIIANMRQYAMRVDPAPGADPADGLLDLVVLPGKHWIRTLGWFARARLRRLHHEQRALQIRARTIQIHSHGGSVPYQIDGEAPLSIASSPIDAPATTPLEVKVLERVVPVLTAGLPESHPTHDRLVKHRQDETDGSTPTLAV